MYVRANREIIRKVRELQHWIGNHTETHETLTNLESTPDELIREVIEAHHRIQEFIGEGPFLFRPPGGAWSSKVADVLNNCDDLKKYAGPIGWNIDCADYDIGSRQTFEECRARYLQSIQERKSGVVLLHDWCANHGQFGERLRINNRLLS